MEKSLSEIKEVVSKLNEADLRQLLIMIFEEKGFCEVSENHGVQEYGKDICFYDLSKLGEKTWYSCVVKTKDINQTLYDEIKRQIRESFEIRLRNIKVGYVPIDKVIVITNGVYKENTRTIISEEFIQRKKDITYWDITDIASEARKIEKLQSYLFVSNIDIIQSSINDKTIEQLNKDGSLKIIYNELNFHDKDNENTNFQVNIRAKLKELEDETVKYLQSSAPNSIITKIPTKFFPDKIEDILRIDKPVLMHGIETSGKTTYIKNIGKEFVSKGINGNVFYFELIREKDIIIDESIEFLISKTASDYTNTIYEINPQKIYLVLLDGLDEISSESDRDIILDKIIDSTEKNKNIKIIITSRTNDYITNREETIKKKFNEYELMPLTVNNMIEIGSKILSKTGKEGAFVKLLKKDALINAFPKTPLVTILLAIIFKEDNININELPRNITELYNKITDIFLNKWDKSKGISEQFKYQEKVFVIQKIAKHLQENEVNSIQEDELLIFLEDLKSKHSIEILNDTQGFIHCFCARSSILMKDVEDNSYRFFHLTMQEYFTSLILNNEDESLLLKNFYQDWWLNTSIFYTGKSPHYSKLLENVAEFKCGLPIDGDSKLAYIIHTTKLLQAAHLISEDNRVKSLKSIIKVFDEFTKELVFEFIDSPESRIQKRTILELILYVRKIFVNFLGVSQFIKPLDIIHKELQLIENSGLSDITEYCISYCISTFRKDSSSLYAFAMKKDLNPRWYKIIDVDVDIKKLRIDNHKIKVKIKSKAFDNKKYIQNQFADRLKKHYDSITGIQRAD